MIYNKSIETSKQRTKQEGMDMTIERIKNYLEQKITNSWYKNAEIDYGVTGKFLDAEIIGEDLKIIWEEMGERLEYIVGWFAEYNLEQIYNIWMEMA